LLREDQEAKSHFHSIDEESEVHTIEFKWLDFCCTGLETFRERLILNDVVTENEATQTGVRAGSGRATNELISSSMSSYHPVDDINIDK
jgi:hypothetical protein